MADKVLGALSLSKKAGRLKTGYDAVCESVLKGKASLVLFASDVSEGTKKRILAIVNGECPSYDLPYRQQELAGITRKAVGVLAVEDEGLAKLCVQTLQNLQTTQPHQQAENQ